MYSSAAQQAQIRQGVGWGKRLDPRSSSCKSSGLDNAYKKTPIFMVGVSSLVIEISNDVLRRYWDVTRISLLFHPHDLMLWRLLPDSSLENHLSVVSRNNRPQGKTCWNRIRFYPQFTSWSCSGSNYVLVIVVNTLSVFDTLSMRNF